MRCRTYPFPTCVFTTLICSSSWDKAAYKYTLAESQSTFNGEDDWEEYLFIERRQFGQNLLIDIALSYADTGVRQEEYDVQHVLGHQVGRTERHLARDLSRCS